jgi:nicotinamidase-related amidase
MSRFCSHGEAISPARLAVVIVDVQVGLFCSKPLPFEPTKVIARINSVIAKARAARVPIIFVQHDGPPNGDWLAPRTDGWQLHPDLNRERGDSIIRKRTGDSFYKTALEQTLRSGGVRSIVLMGFATDFCLDSTLRNAVSKDFEVFVVSDAHTTNDAPTLKAASIRAHFNWAWSESSSRRPIRLVKAREFAIGANHI